MKIASTLFFLLFFISAHAQVVTTQFGQVQGHTDGTVYEFLGIPFAKPPVDTLRWRAPQNPDNWVTTLVADSFAPACPQKYFSQLTGGSTDSTFGSEDCLYLNVWTPNVSNTADLPVLVFIHGGGNQQGSASEEDDGTPMFFGKNMSTRGNAVVVTIQYRLGPLGFLVHPGLDSESVSHTSGNYAVLDQILALKWVKNNITQFGGDTAEIMVFGESAGGVDVGNLLVAPQAAGLFTRAGIESAGPTMSAYSDAESIGIGFVDSFITTGTDSQKIAYMRSLPPDSLVQYEVQPLSNGIAASTWGPALDNVVFPDYPFNLFRTGNFNHVPLLIGSNADETNLTSPPTVTPAEVTQLLNEYFPSSDNAEILAMYPPGTNDSTARVAYVGITTDVQFTDITCHTAQCVSANETQPVWRYFFSYTYPAPQLNNPDLVSYHGMELMYVFNNWENIYGHQLLFKPQDDSLQQIMLNYWVNFARTGNPNGSQSILVNWPQYNANTDCYVEINAEPNGTQCGLRTAQTNMWDSIEHFTPCVDTSSTSTGIAETKSNIEVSVYPNPTDDILYMSGEKVSEVTLTNMTGQVVLHQKLSEQQIKVASLTPGIYIIQMQTASGSTMHRFVKD
jgi:para-nitrobenzyl esterase